MLHVFFYTPWKQHNLWFSDILCGYQKRPVAWIGLRWMIVCITINRQPIIFSADFLINFHKQKRDLI